MKKNKPKKMERLRVKRVKKIGKLKLRLARYRGEQRAIGKKELLFEQRFEKEKQTKILKHEIDIADRSKDIASKEIIQGNTNFYLDLMETQKENLIELIDKKEQEKIEYIGNQDAKSRALDENINQIIKVAYALENMTSVVIKDFNQYDNIFCDIIKRINQLARQDEKIKINQGCIRKFIDYVRNGNFEKAARIKIKKGSMEFR